MLGRNVARPFGMSPSRIVAVYSTAASHRIANWIARPFASVHMHRYITAAPQLLLTNSTTSCSPSSSLDSVLPTIAVAPGTTSVAGIHTSAVSLQQHQQQPNQVQHQHQQAPLSDKQDPSLDTITGATSASSTVGASVTSSAAASSPSTVQTPGSQVAFNYLLAASWHPKSRQRKSSSALSASGSSSSSSSPNSSDDEGDASKAKWWKQKLRAGKVDAGEDAFFHVSTPSRVALGVADGVGGWSEVRLFAIFFWLCLVLASLFDCIPYVFIWELVIFTEYWNVILYFLSLCFFSLFWQRGETTSRSTG